MHRGGCQTIGHGGRWGLALRLGTGARGLKNLFSEALDIVAVFSHHVTSDVTL